LQAAEFSTNQLTGFKSLLFGRFEPYTEEEEVENQMPITFVTLDHIICSYYSGKAEMELSFSPDGRIEIDAFAARPIIAGVAWTSVSLAKVLEPLTGTILTSELKYTVIVDKAELNLLEAVRNPAYSELQIQKVEQVQDYKWKLVTVQVGMARLAELHEFLHGSSTGYGQFTITGIGRSQQIPYRLAQHHRL
jgi:hypothetical protein